MRRPASTLDDVSVTYQERAPAEFRWQALNAGRRCSLGASIPSVRGIWLFLSDIQLFVDRPRSSPDFAVAVARVCWHEVWHVQTRSARHEKRGLLSASVCPADLLPAARRAA